MASRQGAKTWSWSWLRRWLVRGQPEAPEIARARALVNAIDKGGVPLNPARINAIARDIGLEVSLKAPVEQTIQRLRDAVARSGS
jgi:hypothetical protein